MKNISVADKDNFVYVPFGVGLVDAKYRMLLLEKVPKRALRLFICLS